MEITAIRNRQQRLNLRRVIERLSRFRAVLPRSVLAALEFEEVLARWLGNIRVRTAPSNYVGLGVGWAFGRPISGTVVDEEGRDVTTETLSSMTPECRRLFSNYTIGYMLTHLVIEGPASHSEEVDLQARGWNPEGVRDVYDNRLRLETQLVSEFNHRRSVDSSNLDWRKGRLRDVIAARELAHGTLPIFREVLDLQGLTIDSIFDMSGTSGARRNNRRIADMMPTFDVAMTLKASYHRNPIYPWTRNDLFDIDAVSIVLPYCDVVVTDKAIASHIKQTKLASRLDTEVMSNLDDLAEHLSEAPS